MAAGCALNNVYSKVPRIDIFLYPSTQNGMHGSFNRNEGLWMVRVGDGGSVKKWKKGNVQGKGIDMGAARSKATPVERQVRRESIVRGATEKLESVLGPVADRTGNGEAHTAIIKTAGPPPEMVRVAKQVALANLKRGSKPIVKSDLVAILLCIAVASDSLPTHYMDMARNLNRMTREDLISIIRTKIYSDDKVLDAILASEPLL